MYNSRTNERTKNKSRKHKRTRKPSYNHKQSSPLNILPINKSNFLILNTSSSLNTISSFVPPTAIARLLSA